MMQDDLQSQGKTRLVRPRPFLRLAVLVLLAAGAIISLLQMSATRDRHNPDLRGDTTFAPTGTPELATQDSTIRANLDVPNSGFEEGDILDWFKGKATRESYVANDAYEVKLDTTVAHTGK